MSTRSMRNKRKKLRKKRRRQHNYEGADRLLGENVRAKLQRTEGNTSLPPETPSAPSLTRQQQDANSLDALFRTSTELTLSQVGERALSWLLRPVTVERFLSEYYETKPLLVRAKSNKPVGSLLSKEVIFAWIKEGKLNLSEDLTLTRYVDGSRETVTPSDPSTADFDYIRDMYAKQQCSLRLLRPSQFSDALYRIVASLEAFFCCCGGSNAYLTPAGSQGFAPHYDDIDAFVVQVEGRKTWTVYRPYKGEDEQLRQLFPRLPRHSSADFTQDQVAQLQVAYETELCPGDVLYLPRGVVHQAKAPTDTHSLHVTISTGQKNTWGDLLAMALPNVIQGVINDGNKDTEQLRRSLPVNFMEFMGVMHSDKTNHKGREEFIKTLSKAVREVVNSLDPDTCADQMSKRFQHERHNPGAVLRPIVSTSNALKPQKLSLESFIRLNVKCGATLVVESESVVVYHSMKNSRKFCEVEERGLEFDLEDAEAIEKVLKLDPKDEPLQVKDLPCETDQDKLRIIRFLHQENIVDIFEEV